MVNIPLQIIGFIGALVGIIVIGITSFVYFPSFPTNGLILLVLGIVSLYLANK